MNCKLVIQLLILFPFIFWNRDFCNAQTDSSLPHKAPLIIEDGKTFSKFIDSDSNKNMFPTLSAYLKFIITNASYFTPKNVNNFVEINTKTASILIAYNRNYEAYKIMDRVDSYLVDKNPINKNYIAEFYALKSNFYIKFNQYSEAKEAAFASLKYQPSLSKVTIDAYNTIGTVYRLDKIYDTSLFFFNKALQLAQSTNNEAWVGILKGNIGYLNYLKGNYKAAKLLIEEDLSTSLKHNQNESAVFAVTFLLKIAGIEKNQQKIEAYTAIIDSLIKLIKTPTVLYEIYKTKAELYTSQGKYKDAVTAFQLKDAYYDSIKVQTSNAKLQSVSFENRLHREKNANKLLSEQNKRKTQFTITLLVAFILFIIAATSIIVLLYKRKQQQRELLEYKISDIQSELNKNKADLQNVLSNIIQKNEQIKKLKASTKEFEKEEAKEELLVKDQIQSLTLLTESDLSQFNTLFDTAYPNFQNKLIDKFPTITNAEMRLAMLLKLNIDKESIATILGISPESVRKTNLRLRTKLKIKTTNELRKFLSKH